MRGLGKLIPSMCHKNMSSSHQNNLFRIGSIFKCGQMFWPLCQCQCQCQWSGEDLYTEFNVLNVRTYLQLVCGSNLLTWYVIRYCCKSVFCSFILSTKDALKIMYWLRLMDSPSRRYCLAANKWTSYFCVTQSKHIHRRLEFLKDTWPEGNLISIKTMRLADWGGGSGVAAPDIRVQGGAKCLFK